MTLLIELPEESTRLIAHFLSAPDVLNLVSTHPVLYRLLGMSRPFWQGLRRIHYPNFSSNGSSPTSLDDTTGMANSGGHDDDDDWKRAKDAYLLQAHCNSLHAVRWYPVATPGPTAPTAREGHLSCVLGNSNQYIVVTGGYADDDAVYVKDIRDEQVAWQRIVPAAGGIAPQWVYGATLTALDRTRAVRFGGFQAGGYSSETHQVAILHLDANSATGNLQARWEIVRCRLPGGTVVPDTDVGFTHVAARAYHASTMLFDRYLLILGGMQSTRSVLSPILLDCETWTWYCEGIAAPTTTGPTSLCPSPRHGCSVVSDFERGRLVLFGGASGSDLLRSGRDNTEVWALDLNGCCSSDVVDDLQRASLPWKWRLLHADQPSPELFDEAPDNRNNNDIIMNGPNCLSPVEKLNLGRCHASYRVGRDTVLLAFGSGRPTVNSLLGYNLSRDEFFRPAVRGPYLPRARFTFASVFVESVGYLVFHGGFSTQEASEALSDTVVLDLAAGMRRRQLRFWPVSRRAQFYPAVTDQNVMYVRYPGGQMSIMDHIRSSLMNTGEAGRPAAAARILAFLQATQRLTGRPPMFLHRNATGRAQLNRDGSIREVIDRDDGDNAEEDED